MESVIKHIKKGFLKNKELYLETVKYWEQHVLNVLGDKSNDYKVWLNNKTENGDLIIDGNPIYSLIKKDASKALRIVQDEPRSKKPYMQVWTEVFDKGKEGKNIPVLVISLELSTKTLMESLVLIEYWFVKYEKNKFNILIDSLNKKFENNYVPSDKEAAWELHQNLNRLNELTSNIGNSPKKSLASSIKCLYSIHDSWDSKYLGAMSQINRDLGLSIYTCVIGLYGLTTQIEKIKKENTSLIHRRTGSIKNKRNYSPMEFRNIYSKLNTEIQGLNNKLIEDLEVIR